MLGALKRWRRRRIVARAPLDPVLWRQTLARLSFMGGLADEEHARLRETVILFLHDKSIHGAAGLELDAGMQ